MDTARRAEEELIPTRHSLLGRLRNWRDDESWQDFFQTYWRLIYNCSLRAGLAPAEAEEVVQETVIAVSQSIAGFSYDPQRGSFKGWLLTRTRWIIQQRQRDRRRDPLANPPEEGVMEGEALERTEGAVNEFERFWEQEWESNLFEAALERIKTKVDPKHYQIFDLSFIRGWSGRETAETLKVGIGQVHVVKHRLKKMLLEECRQIERQTP